MSGPSARRTSLECAAMDASAAASIWPAPGTVRSMTNFGMVGSFVGTRRAGTTKRRGTTGGVNGAFASSRGARVGTDRVAVMTSSGVRLNELLVALSRATDLGLGQPSEHMLRSARLSMRLGERLGLPQPDLATLYDVSILTYVGCPIFGNEAA